MVHACRNHVSVPRNLPQPDPAPDEIDPAVLQPYDILIFAK